MSNASPAQLHLISVWWHCVEMNIVFMLFLPTVPGVADIHWDTILSLTCKRKKPTNVTLQHWKYTWRVLRSKRCCDNHVYSAWIWLCPKWAANALEKCATICAHCGGNTWAEWLVPAPVQSSTTVHVHVPLEIPREGRVFKRVWQKEQSGESRRISLTHLCRIRGFENTKGTRENDLMLPSTHIAAHHCNILSSAVAISNSFPRWSFSLLSFFLRLLFFLHVTIIVLTDQSGAHCSFNMQRHELLSLSLRFAL